MATGDIDITFIICDNVNFNTLHLDILNQIKFELSNLTTSTKVSSYKVPARYEQGPFKQTEGFLSLYRGEVQKMGQKHQNLSQLSTAHFSGVLQAF